MQKHPSAAEAAARLHSMPVAPGVLGRGLLSNTACLGEAVGGPGPDSLPPTHTVGPGAGLGLGDGN